MSELHAVRFSSPLPVEVRKIAVLGIGNEQNGDDAAGVLVVRGLKEIFEPGAGNGARSLLLIEAGLAPENFTGVLRRFQPDMVLLIDAANLSEEPGSTAWIDWEDVDGMSASTHTLPPTLLAKYLIHEINCRVTLIGIQPAQLDFDSPVSAQVKGSVERLTQALAGWLNT